MKRKALPFRFLFAVICLLLSLSRLNANVSTGFTYQTGCNGFTFFSASTGSNSTYYWNFGDNTTGTGNSVNHTYPPGIYTVTLNVQSQAVNNTYTQQVYIGNYISQQVNGPTDVCTGTTATYYLSNTTQGLTYTWLVSGGGILGSSNSDSVILQFNTSGNAVLSVLVGNATGCDSIFTYPIDVHETPALVLPAQANDSGQQRLVVCQNTDIWYRALTTVPGTFAWSTTTGNMLTAQGVDSMLFIFPNTGGSNIRIVETTPYGCTDSALVAVNITANPTLTVSAQDACFGTDNYFNATPGPNDGHLNYVWTFDDGGHSSDNPATHNFSGTGTHVAQLIATDGNGCRDTVNSTVHVDITPGPEIVCAGPVCAGDVVDYSTTAVSGASYHWTITGGAITAGGGLNDNTVEVKWENGPHGTIQLYLTGPGIYCQFPTTEQVPIIGAGLIVTGKLTPCVYTTNEYTSDIIPGGIYNWTVSGGSIQSGQGTNHISVYFNSTAPVDIQVNVTHQILGCSGNATLHVTPLGQFNVYSSGDACQGLPTTISAYPSGNFTWTVQGGTISSGNGTSSIQALFTAPGSNTVSAYAATGFCNTTSQIIKTVVERKNELIQGPEVVCQGSTELFSISANEYTYAWSVSTGGTINSGSNSNSANITFNNAGAYVVQVIYRNNNYCADTATYNVQVAPASVPDIIGDTLVCYGNHTTYTYIPVTGANYGWEVEGGVVISGQNGSSAVIVWNGEQLGVVRLRNPVCNTFLQKNIVIRPTPAVDIEFSNLNCFGTNADLKVVEDYPAYSWSNSLSTQSIHITANGIYNVTVTDSKGCTASGSENANPIPSNAFTVANIGVSAPAGSFPIAYLELTAYGVPTPTTYLWSTGNEEQSQYVTTAGTYSVTMTNEFGCSASVSVNVTSGCTCNGTSCGPAGSVSACPGINPVFTTNSPVCNPVQFTPGAVANYYLWDFGDGVFSTLSNPTHRFTSTGTKDVFMYYSNDGLNWFKCDQTIVINSVMHPDFTIANGCQGAVTLTNTSTSVLPINSALWRLGDGAVSSTTPVLNYQYTNNLASYPIGLIINDGVCVDSVHRITQVHQLLADFVYGSLCKDNPALFNDATLHSRIIASYSWNFGNSENADYYDPVTYYHTAGNYTAGITVTDAAGCSSNYSQSITVNQFGPLNITASGPLTFCKGNSVDLSVPTGYKVYWNTGDTTGSIHVATAGKYFAWVKDLSTGCSGFTDTVTVIENIPPRAFIHNQYDKTELCAGQPIYLNAVPTSGVTFQWYLNGSALTGSTAYYLYYWNAATTNSGDYQLVIKDANGCNDTSDITGIIVHPLPATPTITQSSTGTHCAGDVVTLSTSGPDFYQWNNGATGFNTSTTQSGSFTLVATNNFGCSSQAYAYVTFAASPDFSLFPSGCYQICQSSNITVHGPAGMANYLWSTGDATANVTLSASGTYILSATASSGCTGHSEPISVDVFGSDNINLGNDTVICYGQSVVLNTGTYPTINWQDGSSNQTFTVTDSGMYWVHVVNSRGCTSADTIMVDVSHPTINLGNDTVLCNGSNLLLTVTGSYNSLQWQDGTSLTYYNVTQAGTYFANGTNQYGCKAGDTINVTTSTASVNLGNDTTLCNGATLQFDLSAYTTHMWQDGSTQGIYTVSSSGAYSVTVTNAGGCTATDAINIVTGSANVNLGPDITICEHNSVVITATGAYTNITWQDGSTTNMYTANTAGIYYASVSDAAGCTASDTVEVNVTQLAVSLGSDTTVCFGQNFALSVNGTFNSIVWQDGSTTSNFNVIVSGLYSVAVTDAAGCSATDTIIVNIDHPTINLGNDTVLCAHSTLLLKVYGSYSHIVWQDGSTSNNYLVTEQGTYSVVVTDGYGCTTEDAINVGGFTETQVDLPTSVYLCTSCVTLSASGVYNSYSWSTQEHTPTISVSALGLYRLSVTDQNGCRSVDSVAVLSCDTNDCRSNYFVPNAFTPNNDGSNDELKVLRKTNSQSVSYFVISIYNRIGEKVFETENENYGWDGNYLGSRANMGVYPYTLTFVCNQETIKVNGAVTLIR